MSFPCFTQFLVVCLRGTQLGYKDLEMLQVQGSSQEDWPLARLDPEPPVCLYSHVCSTRSKEAVVKNVWGKI